ncbi:MAG: heavy metal-binding domain-containing protein [Candidatus Obscuribacterales bacterium]
MVRKTGKNTFATVTGSLLLMLALAPGCLAAPPAPVSEPIFDLTPTTSLKLPAKLDARTGTATVKICQHEFGYSSDPTPAPYQTSPGAPAYQPPGRAYAAAPGAPPVYQMQQPVATQGYAQMQQPGQNFGQQPMQSQAPAVQFPQSMIVTSTMNVDGYSVREYKGIVRGVAVYSPTILQSFKAGFKQIIGGNIGSYTQMSDRARQQAYDRMVQNAVSMGANAVVGMRYDSSAFNTDNDGSMGTEVMCYGTAVIIGR